MTDKDKYDLKQLEIDIRNKLAQEHNWKQQQDFWISQAKTQSEHSKSQQKHWESQRNHWNVIGAVGIAAIIGNIVIEAIKHLSH